MIQRLFLNLQFGLQQCLIKRFPEFGNFLLVTVSLLLEQEKKINDSACKYENEQGGNQDSEGIYF